MNQLKRALLLLIFLLTVLGVYGCGDESQKTPPIELSYTQTYGSVFRLKFTALTDRVRVNSYTVNRGNCHRNDVGDGFFTKNGVPPPGKAPFSLKFGQFEEASIICSNLREVLVDTDQGSYTFTFN